MPVVAPIVQMSADSKAFIRGKWRGCLGVSLCFSNPASFTKSYEDFVTSSFKNYGFIKEKEVYSSRDISEKFGTDRNGFLEFLESLVKKVGKDETVTLNIV